MIDTRSFGRAVCAAGILALTQAGPAAHAAENGAAGSAPLPAAQVAALAAKPDRTVETSYVLNGTTTVIRTRSFGAHGDTPPRVETETLTLAADGTPIERTHSALRITADGALVREHRRTSGGVIGEASHPRDELRRDSAASRSEPAGIDGDARSAI